MANIGAYAEAAMLNWVLGGAAATQPTTRAVGLSLGTPASTSGSEMSVAGYTRQSIGFAAAASPGGSATNTNPMTFGPMGAGATIAGLQVWDTILASGSGNMLFYGLLATARTLNSGDSLIIASGAMTISLS